jgi:ferredoxin-thioredoxin reductase catalytic chain
MSEADELFQRLRNDAQAAGYLLNPNMDDTMMLVDGLLTNIKRYGYASCPCRVASGKKEEDNDMVCPCDYRDADLNDHGACYCALYVTREWIEEKLERHVVPERRPPKARRDAIVAASSHPTPAGASAGKYKVWRCKVCGYLCARDKPPDKCPICKVPADRFEPFEGAVGPSSKYPVWRCKVCGYLCARDKPPGNCPVCKVTADRFEMFP